MTPLAHPRLALPENSHLFGGCFASPRAQASKVALLKDLTKSLRPTREAAEKLIHLGLSAVSLALPILVTRMVVQILLL